MAEPPVGLTPMMRQYRELKRRFPDYLLLFRLGDFYELFFEDAEQGARLLGITLTARQGAPMAGIPHHAAESYIARLVQAGRKIAISEQLEAPGQGRKLLRREVVRLITPGTITDTAYLSGAANNFLLAVAHSREGTGVALLDVSTGDFWVGEDPGAESAVLEAALLRRPAEIVIPEALRQTHDLVARLEARGAVLTFWEPASFAPRRAAAELLAHFGIPSLAVFGVADMTMGLGAAGGALAYVRATQGERLGHLTRLQRLATADAMVLDQTAVETLEIIDARDGAPRASLLGVINETVTPMGSRLLRQWLLRPLVDPALIAERQTAVAALVEAPALRHRLRTLLARIGDLERLTSRATLGVAHARDLVGLRASLEPIDEIRTAVTGLTAPVVATARDELTPLGGLRTLLREALVDEPPLTLHDGGLIREEWSESLAAIVNDARQARLWIAGLEERERTR
ncbi:MAG TPA: DNA mismatch repair protein MutS, partial [Methylomirabilota bacterium]|nr:DNA mismatch repair protein MutS [Methylomirabilota bacterium]